MLNKCRDFVREFEFSLILVDNNFINFQAMKKKQNNDDAMINNKGRNEIIYRNK